MACEDKARLSSECKRDISEWAQAVLRLSDQAGMGQADYLLLLSRVEDARTEVQKTRLPILKHIAENVC